MPYVYQTRNLITNHKYIGYCSKIPEKSTSYFGSGTILQHAIRKYGKENFEKIILKEFDTEVDARIYEEYLIKEVDAINNPEYYNLTKGGFGGWSEASKLKQRSIETRNKIKNTLTGRKRPADVIEKIKLKSNKGQKQDPELIEKRRQGQLRYYQNASTAELADRYKKISEAKTGKALSDEHKDTLGRYNAKYSDDIVLEIKKMINDNVPYKQITAKYGIGAESITRIKQEKSYKWLWRK